jgi:hypothetical protein
LAFVLTANLSQKALEDIFHTPDWPLPSRRY